MKRIIFGLIGSLAGIILFLIGNLLILEHQASVISVGRPVEKDTIQRSALLIIDIQEVTTGDLSTNENYKKSSGELIGKINSIIGTSTGKNIPVIYIRNEISNWGVNLLNNSMEKGSTGVQFDKRLSIATNYIIIKETNDAFSNPNLDSILIAHKINKLIVVGLDAAYCVNSTISAALNRKYSISVIRDAVISENDSLKNLMLDEFVRKKIDLISTTDFTGI